MTIKLYDNSRLSDHRKCNRYFYLRHRRHFAPHGEMVAANFGSCFSKALDILWPAVKQGLPDGTAIELAYDAFLNEWRSTYNFPRLDEMTDGQLATFGFRHDQTAARMLHAYLERRKNFIQSVEILSIEKPFIVPLDPGNPDLFYVGRMDKVIRWNGRVWGLDHKTTSWYRKSGGFAPEWIDGWELKNQPDGYLHALRMEYGSEAKGILIDGILVHAKEDAGILKPIEKTISHTQAWMWELHHEMTIIAANDANLTAHRRGYPDETYDFMPAFPKNENGCISFMKRCPFFDICTTCADPEELTEPPEGYTLERWDPFDKATLEKLGLGDVE